MSVKKKFGLTTEVLQRLPSIANWMEAAGNPIVCVSEVSWANTLQSKYQTIFCFLFLH